jgi:hypothetical protein
MLRGLLQTLSDEPQKAVMPIKSGTTLRCHHCGVVCGPFLRSDFLHSSQFGRGLRRH